MNNNKDSTNTSLVHTIPSTDKTAPHCWHYTVGIKMPMILRSGVLLQATAGVPDWERPAVWFSTNRVWEQTANKRYFDPRGVPHLGTKTTTEKYAHGLYRFGVATETAPHDWTAFRKLSGIKRNQARLLEKSARKMGANHQQWRVSFEPVPASMWVAVERWDGAAWVPASMDPMDYAVEELPDLAAVEAFILEALLSAAG